MHTFFAPWGVFFGNTLCSNKLKALGMSPQDVNFCILSWTYKSQTSCAYTLLLLFCIILNYDYCFLVTEDLALLTFCSDVCWCLQFQSTFIASEPQSELAFSQWPRDPVHVFPRLWQNTWCYWIVSPPIFPSVELWWEEIEGNLMWANMEPSTHLRRANTEPSIDFRKANTERAMHFRRANTETY